MAGEEIIRLVRLEEDERWPSYSVPWEEDIDEADSYSVADNPRQT
jgi:hypothetical protein